MLGAWERKGWTGRRRSLLVSAIDWEVVSYFTTGALQSIEVYSQNLTPIATKTSFILPLTVFQTPRQLRADINPQNRVRRRYLS